MTKDKIAIIGSGALGTSLGKILFDGGNTNIVIYGIDESELADLRNGVNKRYFSDAIKLPQFKTTNVLKDAINGAKYVAVAIPSSVIPVVYPQIVDAISAKTLIICGSKGFFPGTESSLHKKMNELSKANKNIRGVVSLIGPSHAEEMVLEMPTSIAAVSKNDELNKEVQNLFSNAYLRIYAQTDVNGAVVGASYKNVLAIASGIVTGLGFGINTTAALLTRGIHEMAIFNEYSNGKKETIMGLTGLGDLIVTATSDLSRNFTLGRELAEKGKKKALATSSTVEGLFALDIICKIGRKNNLELPIAYFLHDIVKGSAVPQDFREKLWRRNLREE